VATVAVGQPTVQGVVVASGKGNELPEVRGLGYRVLRSSMNGSAADIAITLPQ
jgi:hypothetical protein